MPRLTFRLPRSRAQRACDFRSDRARRAGARTHSDIRVLKGAVPSMARGRAIWSGSIVFGLVNIPIKLHTAIREKSVHLHMLNKEGDCRLHRKLYCPETGEEYDFHD